MIGGTSVFGIGDDGASGAIQPDSEKPVTSDKRTGKHFMPAFYQIPAIPPVTNRLAARVSHRALAIARAAPNLTSMFTIEHEFDATVVTLVDEPGDHLEEDVTINAFEDCVTLEQLNPRSGEVQKITLSLAQLDDLAAALDLPEGVYRIRRETGH